MKLLKSFNIVFTAFVLMFVLNACEFESFKITFVKTNPNEEVLLKDKTGNTIDVSEINEPVLNLSIVDDSQNKLVIRYKNNRNMYKKIFVNFTDDQYSTDRERNYSVDGFVYEDLVNIQFDLSSLTNGQNYDIKGDILMSSKYTEMYRTTRSCTYTCERTVWDSRRKRWVTERSECYGSEDVWVRDVHVTKDLSGSLVEPGSDIVAASFTGKQKSYVWQKDEGSITSCR